QSETPRRPPGDVCVETNRGLHLRVRARLPRLTVDALADVEAAWLAERTRLLADDQLLAAVDPIHPLPIVGAPHQVPMTATMRHPVGLDRPLRPPVGESGLSLLTDGAEELAEDLDALSEIGAKRLEPVAPLHPPELDDGADSRLGPAETHHPRRHRQSQPL